MKQNPDTEVTYAVKQLAKLAGVSVRTLHLYDKIGLLKPSVRTYSNYRRYGTRELLRLQQILFYKELDFPLKEIKPILDDPQFNLVLALEGHRQAITERRNRLDVLLHTIDNTVNHLKNKTTMNNYEKLYEGMPKEQAAAWRNDAIEKWGEEAVTQSEQVLLNMPIPDLEQLKADQRDIRQKLKALRGADSKSDEVQEQIARHYANIRGFWGLKPEDGFKAERYKGLAELYVTDERYLAEEGKPDPELAQMVRAAMVWFADTKLR